MNFLNRKNEKATNIEECSKTAGKGRLSRNELGYSIYKAIEFRNASVERKDLMLQLEYVRNRF